VIGVGEGDVDAVEHQVAVKVLRTPPRPSTFAVRLSQLRLRISTVVSAIV